MRLDVQFWLSASWAVLACAGAAIAGELTGRFAAVVFVIALFHAMLGIQLRRAMVSMSPSTWYGLDAAIAVTAWALLSLLVLVAAMLSRESLALAATGMVYHSIVRCIRRDRQRPRSPMRRHAQRALLTTALCGGAFALYVAVPALSASRVGYAAYDAAVWIDAPFHASYVLALARGLADGHYVDIHGYDLPVQLYHHASYAIAGLIAATSGVPALALTQVSTAWGGLWLTLGVYALAALFSARPQVAAVAALLVLAIPDVGMLPWGHSLYGFHWLLQVASASSVALSVALCALALLIHGCRTQCWQLVVTAWGLTAAVIAFKGQIFVVIAVPVFLYPVLTWPSLSRGRRGMMLVAQVALVAAVTWVGSFLSSAPLVRYDFSVGNQWLSALAVEAPESQKTILKWAASRHRGLAAAVMAVAYCLWLFSLWAGLASAVNFIRKITIYPGFARPESSDRSDTPIPATNPSPSSGARGASRLLIPCRSVRPLFAFAALFVLTVVGLAADNRQATGGPLEVQVQAQIWGYAMFAVGAALLVADRVWRGLGQAGLAATVALSLTAFALLSPPNVPLQRATRIVVPSFRAAPSPNELVALRSLTGACDVVFVADGDRYFVWQAGLERPSWVVDYALNPRHRPEVANRLAQWRVASENIEQWLSARGIEWYVLPRTTEASLHKAPNRAPDLVQPSFDAWRISAMPRPCG